MCLKQSQHSLVRRYIDEITIRDDFVTSVNAFDVARFIQLRGVAITNLIYIKWIEEENNDSFLEYNESFR